MPMTDNELRQKYLFSKKDRYFYLEMYRTPPPTLSPLTKQLMWIAATDVVKGAATSHFRKYQGGYATSDVPGNEMTPVQEENYDKLVERVLILIDCIKTLPLIDQKGNPTTTALAVANYKRRFGQLDHKNFLEKRSRTGFSFSFPVKDSDDWEYGTYVGAIKPAIRPALVDSHQEMQRLYNCIYRKFNKTLSPDEVLLILTQDMKKPTIKSAEGIVTKLQLYTLSTMMENACSLNPQAETNDYEDA